MRKLIPILLVIAMLMGLVGCTNTTPSTSGEPSTGGSSASGGSSSQGATTSSTRDNVIYGWSNEPSTLDPHMTSDSTALGACYQMYDGLIREEKDGTLACALCTDYALSEDLMDITFHIREGVKFHNGDVMTADDVVFSLNRSIGSSYTTKMTSAFDSCEKIDDNTVVLHLKFPYAAAIGCLSNANCSIVDKAVVEADENWALNNPVGTGAYKFASWTTGVEINFDSFADYYRGEASIKHLTMKTITDTSALIIALENGDIDFIDTPIMSARQSLIDNADITYDECNQACYYLIAFNCANGHFTDERVRQAVSYAVDRDTLLLGALDGVGSPVYEAMVPICSCYDPDFKTNEYNIDKAKELMAEAGYADGFTISVPTMPGGTYGTPTEILQDMLSKIGITIEIDYQERGTWMSEVLTKNNYEMTFWAVPITVNDPDLACYTTFHSKYINGSGNFCNISDAELDALLEQGRAESDSAKRNEIYTKVCELVNQHSYLIPLYTGTRRIAHVNALQGVKADPVLKYYVYEWYWAE